MFIILRGLGILPGLASCKLGMAVYMDFVMEMFSSFVEQVSTGKAVCILHCNVHTSLAWIL
jgi:hypothetical protein